MFIIIKLSFEKIKFNQNNQIMANLHTLLAVAKVLTVVVIMITLASIHEVQLVNLFY